MPRRRPPYRPPVDWRDPSMPVLRDYRFPDGTRKTEIDPEYESRYRKHMIESSTAPDYRSDPTYNLNRKARK